MSNVVHVFDYLAAPQRTKAQAVNVLFGTEHFLRQLCLRQLKSQLLGAGADDVPIASFDGETVEWRDVHDELATLSLFGGLRVTIVYDAAEFVTRCRDKLEEYVAKPRKGSVLILLVDSWPSNTRLFKAVGSHGLQIECRPPEVAHGKNRLLDQTRVCRWLVYRAKTAHQSQLSEKAAVAMLDLVGPEFGILEQELAKLALFVAADQSISPELVHEVVGGWRTKTAWELIDAAVSGNAGEALSQLDKLLSAGQEPIALMGAVQWSLRRFATASRVFYRAQREGSPISLSAALLQAGFRNWPANALTLAERQMSQLGRERTRKLYRWLLETDLALKGTHSSPDRARLAIEQLLIRLSSAVLQRRSATAV